MSHVVAQSTGDRWIGLDAPVQRLRGQVSRYGLEILSTVDGAMFRTRACAVGGLEQLKELHSEGRVERSGSVLRYIRPLVTEEYSASLDGLRQDFVVEKRLTRSSPLVLVLDVLGAGVSGGSHLVLIKPHESDRSIRYDKLRVVDADGRPLAASMTIIQEDRIMVTVEDAAARYPVRIDPTFSDANWVDISSGGIPGTSGEVLATAVDAAGNLYIGGDFEWVAGVSARNLAMWNGSAWSEVGGGVNSDVNALAVQGTDVYVAGSFTEAGGSVVGKIARWNGTSWSTLGSGVTSAAHIDGLTVSGTDLFAVGNFTAIGSVLANRVARWNGTTWSALGLGVPDAAFCVATIGSSVYVGGQFSGRLARWDGSTWSFPAGASGTVYALAVIGNDLYVGGGFTTLDLTNYNRIAKWNGTTWSGLGTGLGGTVRTLAVLNGELYAGGTFTTAGGMPADRVAKWNGSTWTALGTGVDGEVRAMATDGSHLFTGGMFKNAGGQVAEHIAAWDLGAWSPMGWGTNGQVKAVLRHGTDLYIGGTFTSVGGVPALRIARWDGSTWSQVGNGFNGDVRALAVHGTDVYAGGSFSSSGGTSVSNVARWDGAGWVALGSGANGLVNALASDGTYLYVGGEFTITGGVFSNRIARWNGSAFAAMSANGMNGAVYALAVDGTEVYAGGSFTSAGGASASRIARWDGVAWHALGTGMSTFSVRAIAVGDGMVYAGGDFAIVGPNISRLARWDGTVWAAVGGAPNNDVRALAWHDSALYAGGDFFLIDGLQVNRIAKWQNGVWSSMASGLNADFPVTFGFPVVYTVHALAASAIELIAGGYFQTSGAITSSNIARAVLGPDTDGDGVVDELDLCPQTPDPGQTDADGDGTGDVCDGCPNDPQKVEPGPCGCGVPEGVELCNGVDDDCDGDTDEDCTVQLEVKVMLEGPFDPGLQLMNDQLRASGLIPLSEPYTSLGYPNVGGSGGESTTPVRLGVTGVRAPVDWVRVEIRTAGSQGTLSAACHALLLRDGTIMDPVTGDDFISLTASPGDYHVAVRHRNHLGAMTSVPIALSSSAAGVDFTLSSTATSGTDARKSIGSAWALWAGDVNGDHQLKYTGTGNDRDPVLVAVGGTVPTNTLTGQYRAEDVNLDGVVKYTGSGNDRDPILVNIGGTVPTNARQEQVP